MKFAVSLILNIVFASLLIATLVAYFYWDSRQREAWEPINEIHERHQKALSEAERKLLDLDEINKELRKALTSAGRKIVWHEELKKELSVDSDGDGVIDYREIMYGYSHENANDTPGKGKMDEVKPNASQEQ